MRTRGTSAKGVAVLMVTLGGLAIPWGANAEPSCDFVKTALAYRDGVKVFAEAEAQIIDTGGANCDQAYFEFPLAIELHTPAWEVFSDYTGWGAGWGEAASAEVKVEYGQGVPIASDEGGFGWYIAYGWADYLRWYDPWEHVEWGPLYAYCFQGCEVAVLLPTLELSGPTSTQQHSGVYISASLDPSYMVPAIDWQGCSAVPGNNASCFFPASATGKHVITASIEGGGPSEQWTVQVSP